MACRVISLLLCFQITSMATITGKYCGNPSKTNSPIYAITPLTPNARYRMIDHPHIFTSINTAVTGGQTLVHLGTDNGHLLKVGYTYHFHQASSSTLM